MSLDRDPIRLHEASADRTDALTRAVQCARSDGPSPQQLAAMATALGLPGPAGGGGSAATPPVAASEPSGAVGALSRVAPKPALVMAAAALLVASIGALHVTSQTVSPPVSSSASTRDARQITIASVTRAKAPVALPDEASSPAPATPQGKVVTHRVAPHAVSPRASAADPAEELALLERAHAVLVTQPARTLGLVKEHSRLYPHGAFVEEREVLAVQALFRLGRGNEATERAQRLQASHPNSAYRQRLATLLSSHGRAAR